MVKSLVLFIEGTKDDSNGNLRQGFNKLLSKELQNCMPRIKMGDNTSDTIKTFIKTIENGGNALLLVDLDKTEEFRNPFYKENNIENYSEISFLMIQEMESWFISQPDVLEKFYGIKLSNKIRDKQPSLIENPDILIERLTKKSKRGKYHKVNHAALILEILDSKKLMESFIDFKNLISFMKR
jgi:hypothetical protein